MGKINNEKGLNKRRKSVYILVVLFIIFVIAIMLYNEYNAEEIYLVNKGVIEYTTTGIGYVIKDETIVEIDSNKVLVSNVSEGSRVSKGNTIASYRGKEYEEHQAKLREIDTQILDAMKDIKLDYSIEISNLEEQAVKSIITTRGSSSMVEMHENINNINSLLRKRASIIGELSPEEAYIKELMNKRETLEEELKKSSSNITAPIGGIISYNIDGLEDKLTKETLMSLNFEDVKGYINANKDISTNKIKIVSNYEAYIMVRVEKNEYIENGKEYTLKIMGLELNELTGKIIKFTETEQGVEIVFRITNGIENIVENRECEIEIVWTNYQGLVVPVKAIKNGENDKKYVTIVTRGDYVDIPILIKRQNNTYAIVENYEKENINDYILERYDQVVMITK